MTQLEKLQALKIQLEAVLSLMKYYADDLEKVSDRSIRDYCLQQFNLYHREQERLIKKILELDFD